MREIWFNIITQNEIESLKNVLTQILPIADGIVICDGGSTDGTQEYLKDIDKVTLVHRPFDYHFANQRNHCLENTPKDVWVFRIDSDEMMSFQFARDLRLILSDAEDYGVDRITMDILHMKNDLVHANEDKGVELRCWVHGEHRYEGKTHEYIVSDSFKGQVCGIGDHYCLLHLKYLLQNDKRERYLKTGTYEKEHLDKIEYSKVIRIHSAIYAEILNPNLNLKEKA